MDFLSQKANNYYIKSEGNILDAHAFDKLVFSISATPFLKRAQITKQIVIDLERSKKLNLYGEMGIFLLGKFLNKLPNRNFNIKYPSNGTHNAGFETLRNIRSAAKSHDPKPFKNNPFWQINDKENSIIMFMFIEDVGGIRKLLDSTINIFQPYLTKVLYYSEQKINYIQNIIGELTQNIIDHSVVDSMPKGYIALAATKRKVEIVVMDLGIGIPKRLGDSIGIKDEFLALKLAFNKRVSSRLSERRGIGLLEVKKMIEDSHGYLSVRSNRAKVSFSPETYKPLGKNWLSSTSVCFPGTQIEVLFPNKKH